VLHQVSLEPKDVRVKAYQQRRLYFHKSMFEFINQSMKPVILQRRHFSVFSINSIKDGSTDIRRGRVEGKNMYIPEG
jgi:hypothetical protein